MYLRVTTLIILSVFIASFCITTSVLSQNTMGNINRYTGNYLVPEDDYFQGGVLTFKIKNRMIVGRMELSVKPMGGLAIEEIRVINLSKNGEGKFVAEGRIYDRHDQLLQKTAKRKGKIAFRQDGVQMDNVFYKKQ